MSIEAEIVRLVSEIADDEKNYKFHKEESITRYSEQTRIKEAKHADIYKESMERKIELLRILKS